MTNQKLIQSTIDGIIDDIATDNGISSIFPKVQILVHELKNEQLTAWFNAEQYGYFGAYGKIELPKYRVSKVVPCAHLIQKYTGRQSSNYRLPTHNLNEKLKKLLDEFPFRDSIHEIQDHATKSKDVLYIAAPIELVPLFSETLINDWYINQLFYAIPISMFINILAQVKATLLQFLLEIKDTLGMKIDLKSDESKKIVDRIVHQTIIHAGVVHTGSGSVEIEDALVIGGQNHNISISSEMHKHIASILPEIENETNKKDIEEIKTELAKENPSKNKLKTFFQRISEGTISNLASFAIQNIIQGLS